MVFTCLLAYLLSLQSMVLDEGHAELFIFIMLISNTEY